MGDRTVLRVFRPYVGEMVREVGDVFAPTLVLRLPPVMLAQWGGMF